MRAPGVLLATSEAYPVMKTGGLADAVAALASALRDAGLDARLVIPAYQDAITQLDGTMRVLRRLKINGDRQEVTLHVGELPQTKIPLYLVDAPALFDRPGDPYSGPDGRAWPDNAQRFATFSRAVVALALNSAGAAWQPQVLHCNDWQTGLAPALLSTQRTRPASVFVIHNLAYQGLFPFETFRELDLPQALWSPDGIEFHDQVSFMKGGLAFADKLVTVSPTYAREILTPEFGCGLDGLLHHRRDQLRGILNGVDYTVWDPRHDPFIAQPYWTDSLSGKLVNKRALQSELGLSVSDDAFLIASIGRLADQKGTDLILDALPDLLAQPNLQMVVLGTGDQSLERRLQSAAAEHPSRMAVYIGYSEALAHRIEAGADAFLMPSRFEPCGLSQLYSLRYGTVPIVHATGGLADTVVDMLEGLQAPDTTTGFVFDHLAALAATVVRAMTLFNTERPRWRQLMINGMRRDFGWPRSVTGYRSVYDEALSCVADRYRVDMSAGN